MGLKTQELGSLGLLFCIPDLDIIKYKRLSEGVSVYTTELLAIIWAMQRVEEIRPGPVVIGSDSAQCHPSMSSQC